ncbi:MbtH family protein [Streptomyces griseoluteus]|uniref:MbtH family protein n=1 Tax=Streptomyces griseoluteus TaxID=29306 RepID=UPI0033182DAE
MTDEDIDSVIYKVVFNDEDQYSIWPASRETPFGWKEDGTSGTKEVCLARVREIADDLRPPRLRRAMEAAKKKEEEG